ncbi:unnamed protein product [Orchesella dallaii]|uniref:Uncharacterized protein n=1 Tax=Orchesella dallaii TaxID=48710 RepID=A0ABP1R475_9HEXA
MSSAMVGRSHSDAEAIQGEDTYHEESGEVATRSSRLEENKDELQRLQLESQQLEALMKQRIIKMQNHMLLLNQENSILEKQMQLEYEDEAASSFGADKGLGPTPRRPTVPPPPPPTKASSTERKGEKEGWSHGERVFAASKAPTNPSVTVMGERRHPFPNKEEKESALPIPEERVHRFLPTPRRPTIPPSPSPTPASSTEREGETDGWRHNQGVFAACAVPTNAPGTVKGEWRHPVPKTEEKESYKPRFHGSTSRLGTPQILGHGGKEAIHQHVPTRSMEVVPAVSCEEALANALLKVLSAQSKTTEKFVARQSLKKRNLAGSSPTMLTATEEPATVGDNADDNYEMKNNIKELLKLANSTSEKVTILENYAT